MYKYAVFCIAVAFFAWQALSAEAELEKMAVEEEPPAPAIVEVAPTPKVVTESVLELDRELELYINECAEEYGLDAVLVRAVIYVESRGVINADNGQCYGLMQLNTAYKDTFMEGAGVNSITNARDNIKAGCWWLSELMEWAQGDETLAVAAYNLGQTGAKAVGGKSQYAARVEAAKELFIESEN